MTYMRNVTALVFGSGLPVFLTQSTLSSHLEVSLDISDSILYDLRIGERNPMASLTAKVVHGKTYYYARECQRVNGTPKIVRTIYLGSADDLIAAALKQRHGQAPQPQSVDIAAFGDVVALFDLAQQIGLVDLLDRHLP